MDAQNARIIARDESRTVGMNEDHTQFFRKPDACPLPPISALLPYKVSDLDRAISIWCAANGPRG